jgi:type IV secretion system protein VirD4
MRSASSVAPAPQLGAGRRRAMLMVLALDVVVAFAVATRYVAGRLHDHPNLGRALYEVPASFAAWLVPAAVLTMLIAALLLVSRARRAAPAVAILALLVVFSHGRLYAPQRLLAWSWAYRRVAQLAPILRDGWIMFGTAMVPLVGASLLALPRRGGVRVTDSHGSASWGDGRQLRSTTGLMLGRDAAGRLLRYAGDAHLLTVAPTRAGKGIGLVIPALLTCPDSMFVTDPKGENYRLTADRRRAMGHNVVALDPYGVVTHEGAQLNALDLISDNNPEAGEDAWYLADLLVDPEDRGADSAFWNESARALIAGLILHVATAPKYAQDRDLPGVRAVLCRSATDFADVLADMSKDKSPNGLIRRTAAQLSQMDERTRAGVLATAYAHTHFLDSALLAAAMSRSSVSFTDTTQPMTVYLIVPRRRTKTARRFCRLVVGTFLREVTTNFDRSRSGWLVLLDEVQNLGRLDPIEDEFTIAAGAGVRFWLIAQDIAGLRRAYPKSWESFVSNADITMLFGINDFRTADLVSKLTGDSTVRVASENRSAGVSHGRGGGSQESASASVSEHGRRLLFPDEARRLARDEVIIFPRGGAPVRARRLDYRTDPDLAPLLRGRLERA